MSTVTQPTGARVSAPHGWFLILTTEALVALALLLVGNQDPQTIPLRLFQFAALSVTGIVGWVWTLTRRSRIDPRLGGAIALFLISACLSAIASPYATVAWSSIWHAVCVVGTALLFIHQASDPVGRRNLVALLTIVFVVIVVAYLIVVGSMWLDWLALGLPISHLPLRPANIGGILSIPTWFGDAVVVTAPIALVTLWMAGRGGRIAAAALVLLAGVAIFITATRSIWILIPIGVVVFVVASGIRGAVRFASAGIVAAVLGIIAIVVTGAGGMILRDVDAGRSSAFASAIQLATERPILGGGLGTYGIWRLDDDVVILAHRAFPNAHNLVLNTLAETGLIGLGLWILAVGLLVWICLERVRAGGTDRLQVAAAIAGLAMLLGHAMVDVVIEQRGLLFLTLMVAAIAIAPTREAAESHRMRITTRPAAVIAVLLVLALIPAIRAEIAMSSLAAGRPADAAGIAPDVGPIQVGLAVEADRAGDVRAARAATEAAEAIEGTASHEISLAWLALSAGEAQSSIDRAMNALSHDRLDPFVLLNVLPLLDDGAHGGDQLDALTSLYVAEPAFLIDPMTSTTRTLATEARSDAMDRLLAGDRAHEAMIIALTADDRESAERVLAAVAPALRGDLTRVVDAWFGDAAARSRLYDATSAAPEASAIWMSWYVAAHACERTEAQRWRRALVILTGQPPIIPDQPRVAPGPALWPTGYPQQVWRVAQPSSPYVTGTWTYPRVSPDCLAGDG